ncbi:prenyltransferase/squalene oxidase repeat-containing protein [Planctomicrobium sp. SH668]|uniref:prenyltransferase/squalene oxidase repeat-containing protein n=1 Tax=Planctomicrobium sp. SH668 TaxID=3448126 RepID=UPI003F5BE95B
MNTESQTSSEGTSPENEESPLWLQLVQRYQVYLMSGLIHFAILLTMALVVVPGLDPKEGAILVVDNAVDPFPVVELEEHFEITPQLRESMDPGVADMALPSEKIVDTPSPVDVNVNDKELAFAAENAVFLEGLPTAGAYSGRTEKGRSILASAYGGTAGSEAAVANGLEWLKRHQKNDGGWSFDHRCPDCDGTCSNPGNEAAATAAATSMALLCFIGAGHTHEEGKYKEEVKKGLNFLKTAVRTASTTGDARQITSGGAGAYTQGFVTIMYCELFGLTRDRSIGHAAERCIKFIIDAQHPRNGGWRYQPGDPTGDTSVVGWMIMAQTSAKMSRISVSQKSQRLASKFLDSVEMEGAYYGYTGPSKNPSTTAIGLLCRMYEGRKKTDAGLAKGVAYLSEIGPMRDNMYYNYYATQVLHHWGGEDWNRWNAVMREILVQTQDQEGHGKGSWAPRDPHGSSGGRHYMTCLSILTLEVYYRHLPIFQARSVGDSDAKNEQESRKTSK